MTTEQETNHPPDAATDAETPGAGESASATATATPAPEPAPEPAPAEATAAVEPPPSHGRSAGTGDLSEAGALRARLEERNAQHVDMEAQLRRMAADFENFRRRQAVERENLIKFAGERILERFLEVMDNFERALQAGEKATDPKQVVTGVSMIYRQLNDFLAKEGLEAMDAKGSPFDPNQHEGVVQMDVDDVPDQTVLEVFRKGYLLNGRVLRHAMVKVANNPTIPALPAEPLEPVAAIDPTPTTSSDEPAQADSVQ